MTSRRRFPLSLLAIAAAIFSGALFESAGVVAQSPAKPTRSELKIDEPRVQPSFRVELVYAPPLKAEGSWVSLTIDDKGRLIACDQYGLMYRVTPSALGKPPSRTHVERLRAAVGCAQGMAFVDGALYVVLNGQLGLYHSGLYRVTDANGDDEFDKIEELLPLHGDGEHGPHAVVPSPDGKSLYLCAGNHTGMPVFSTSRVPAGWGEDQLLPRLDDPAGQAAGVPAPGGWIIRTNLDGQQRELVSVGYRNIYDMAFNADGELFTFDSDLDVDIGTPWYRPPSLLHVTSGADYGWRGGDGLWPTYYPDTLPPVATTPPGSPTGMTFATGTKFPGRHKECLFVGDWSRGFIYAVRLTPEGASYHGACQLFAEGVTGVTDLVVRPQDGALYFTVGGRRTQSGLYRIVWTGDSKQATENLDDDSSSDDFTASRARAARRELEELHVGQHHAAETAAWPSLSSPDRFLRYTALTALETTDSLFWQKQALHEPNVLAKFTALVALSRRDEPTRPDEWVDAILAADFPNLSTDEQQTALRAAALGVMRYKRLTPAMLDRLAGGIAKWFPTGNLDVDRELAKLLLRLKSPAIVGALAAQLAEAASPEQAVDAAVTLSAATAGWTPQSRTALFDWFDAAAKRDGRRSFYPYLIAARQRFITHLSADEKKAFAARLAPPPVPSDADEQANKPARPFVKNWTADEVAQLVADADAKRSGSSAPSTSAAAVRNLYSALGCASCHAIAGVGSAVGPDLTTVGRRYSVADLARAIVDPGQEIPDLYRQTTFVASGRTVTGRVTNMTASTISVTANMRDPASAVTLRRDEIESQMPSPLSAMPDKLLDSLTAEEIVSLFNYLRAGANHASASPDPVPAAALPDATPSSFHQAIGNASNHD